MTTHATLLSTPLPVNRQERPAQLVERANDPKTSLQTAEKPIVLLAEDNEDLNSAVSEILANFNYQVISTFNGVEALQALEQQIPDVILCDITMPKMNGYELLRHARADARLRTTPFIFMTARTSTDDQRLAREIGIDDYLTKPVETANLLAALKNALRRRRMLEEEIERQADDLRSRIVALLQHEFRTPLTFVLGYAELLLDAAGTAKETLISSDELRMSASAILDGGKRLQRLIETFLMLADLQNRQTRREDTDTITAAELWRDVIQQFASPLYHTKLTANIDEKNKSSQVTVDPELIREALRRLVDNAIQYRRPDSANLWISVERLPVYVGFRIRDEGKGMQPELLEQYVRPFEHGSGQNDRPNTGPGLSLTLVHHIAQLHGGKLELVSEFGKGSTFTLWLPEAAVTKR